MAGSGVPRNCFINSTSKVNEQQTHYFYFTLFLLGLGPLGPPRGSQDCGSKIFSPTFPAMLLRLVGTADTAGDCEKPLGSQAHHCTPYMYFPPSQRAPSPSLHTVCSRCRRLCVNLCALHMSVSVCACEDKHNMTKVHPGIPSTLLRGNDVS